MQSKVTIAASKDGSLINIFEKNPELGSIRVEQIVVTINETGWLKPNKRSAFIKGKVQDLIDMNYKVGDTLPGKIIVQESLTPFNSENPDRDLKTAGITGVICTIDDQPIYRQSFYTSNMKLDDVLIAHDNTDEIKAVQEEIKKIHVSTEATTL